MSELKKCSNTAAGSDRISFVTIKKIAPQIANPLLVIFQQSLIKVYFQSNGSVQTLCTRTQKGERSNASSYRQISTCSCVGKLLEKIVKE